ncbi:MAG: branched-chain amino acid ABC transporter permease [Bacteroides sp.]|nr:branched-chain amino acid ABC transporter permease [Eubacterium sp.]MCM1418796.1 branched-chain amino acid ABC transporter permease [Roseburia sp.]MCM1462453.1 branched-chain amino acid ABC transporter permease [Bacteroides sp.]
MNKRKNLINQGVTYGIVIVAYAVMMILQATGNLSSSMRGYLVPLCIYIVMAVSLNLVVGILGELSLGHAGFMCIGAYCGAVFSQCTETLIGAAWLRFTLAILVGAVAAAIFGILIGIPVLRLKGDYLAIVTLAFGEIIKNIVNVIYLGVDSRGLHLSFENTAALGLEADGKVVIKGAQGITGTPQDSTFTVGFILVLITLFVVLNLVHSRDGRAIMSIRDNRIAAESIGINITKYKLMVFTISAALAGAAGVLYSHNYATLTSAGDKFNYNASIMILVYVVLGGIGSIRGSVIATIILYILPERLRFIGDYRMLVYAVVLIAVMLFNWSPKAIGWRQAVVNAIRAKLFKNKTKPTEGGAGV